MSRNTDAMSVNISSSKVLLTQKYSNNIHSLKSSTEEVKIGSLHLSFEAQFP